MFQRRTALVSLSRWLMAGAVLGVALGCLAGTHSVRSSAGNGSSVNLPGDGSRKDKTRQQAVAENTRCLECHKNLSAELITRVHVRHGIGCADCHGPSTAHMEGDGTAVPADIAFGRAQVDAFCGGCHENPHEHPERVDAFREEWKDRPRPHGRRVTADSVCTDCHGHHLHVRLAAATQPAGREDGRSGWVSLFNGRDLTGWEPSGGAVWKVENGYIVGTQGPDYAAGDLFTRDSYRDFELKVTYRVEWPANGGIWFRYQNENVAYQADILEWPKPVAYAGTIYCPGKMFLAINPDPDLVNRTGWNTIRVRAQGDRLMVWLNDFLTGDVRDKTTDHGRIGFQVHPGEQFGPMKIIVRRVILRTLSAEEAPDAAIEVN